MKAKLPPFAFALLLSTAAFAQDYAIHLDRPLEVGTELKLSITSKRSQSVTAATNGVTKKDEKREFVTQFDGTEKVLEADAGGVETKIALTVEKFTVTFDGKTVDVLPKGTVVTASVADQKQIYEVDGKPVGPDQAEILGTVIDLSRGGPTDDECYGATGRKKKGDSWEINAGKTKASFESAVKGMTLDHVTGKSSLDAVTADALKIATHVTGNPKPPLPPGFTVDQSLLDATFTGIFPIDAGQHPPEDWTEMSISFSAHADSATGEKITLKSSTVESVDRKTTLLK